MLTAVLAGALPVLKNTCGGRARGRRLQRGRSRLGVQQRRRGARAAAVRVQHERVCGAGALAAQPARRSGSHQQASAQPPAAAARRRQRGGGAAARCAPGARPAARRQEQRQGQRQQWQRSVVAARQLRAMVAALEAVQPVSRLLGADGPSSLQQAGMDASLVYYFESSIGGAYIQELSDDPTAMPAAAALGQALHEAAVALPGHAAAARLAPQGRASLRQPVLRQPGGRARAGGHGEAQPAVRCLPHDTVRRVDGQAACLERAGAGAALAFPAAWRPCVRGNAGMGPSSAACMCCVAGCSGGCSLACRGRVARP